MYLHFTIWFPVLLSTTAMYLHSLCFIVWVQFPACVTFLPKGHYPHHHVATFTAFHCVGFNFLHWSPPLPCTYIYCIGSICCIGGLYALRAQSSPPCTCTWVLTIPIPIPLPCYYSLCISLCGFLCGSPPPPYTYIPGILYMGSIHCMGDLFALSAQYLPPCIYIPCISLCGTL